MLLQLNYNKRVRLKSKLRAISEHSNEQVQVRNRQTFQYSMFIKVNVLCTDLQLKVRVSWKNHRFFSQNNWHVLLMMYIDQAHEQTFKLQCNFSLICL